MNRVRIALVGMLLLGSGCAHQATATNDPRWLLMASPATRDYPWGWSHMPLAQWEPLMAYPSEDTCDRSLRDAQNVVQSPVTCVSAEDGMLGARARRTLAMSNTSHGGDVPMLSSLAVER